MYEKAGSKYARLLEVDLAFDSAGHILCADLPRQLFFRIIDHLKSPGGENHAEGTSDISTPELDDHSILTVGEPRNADIILSEMIMVAPLAPASVDINLETTGNRANRPFVATWVQSTISSQNTTFSSSVQGCRDVMLVIE